MEIDHRLSPGRTVCGTAAEAQPPASQRPPSEQAAEVASTLRSMQNRSPVLAASLVLKASARARRLGAYAVPPMPVDRKQLVRDAYAAFAAGDRDFYERHLSETFL